MYECVLNAVLFIFRDVIWRKVINFAAYKQCVDKVANLLNDNIDACLYP